MPNGYLSVNRNLGSVNRNSNGKKYSRFEKQLLATARKTAGKSQKSAAKSANFSKMRFSK
ncbi:hypothetical protein GCM10010301_73240 [Streptomyces plicatus]|nr:hypothetical protein GCM10010301_73240 [Streptomyces plicatus]